MIDSVRGDFILKILPETNPIKCCAAMNQKKISESEIEKEEIATIAILNNLQQRFECDLLTCYFKNKHSELYRLFYKGELDPNNGFRFPWQMSGPLSHPSQEERMRCTPLNDGEIQEPTESSNVLKFFESPDDNDFELLSSNVLNGVSFVNREEIKCIWRIRLVSDENHEAVIFLNYRSYPVKADAIDNILNRGWLESSEAKKILRQSGFPYLLNRDAWRLRGITYSLIRDINNVMLLQRPEWAKLWQKIPEFVQTLLHPKSNEHLTCQLYGVNRNGQLQLLSKNSDQKEEIDGIVYHVARTGQVFLIEDIQEYRAARASRVERGQMVEGTMPDCVQCSKSSRSELVCPLMIQGKVIGVIKTESHQLDANADYKVYDKHDSVILYQFASMVAMAVRQYAIWNDLNIINTFQERIHTADSEVEIYSETINVVKELDYTVGIWAFDSESENGGEWARGSQFYEGKVRGNEGLNTGHTEWIRLNRVPLAINDIRKVALGSENLVFVNKTKGCLDSNTGLFQNWEGISASDPLNSIEPNPGALKMFDDAGGAKPSILSDFGFPLFEDAKRSSVAAVLWAKCLRHSLSVLDDEMWCLSLICRSASEARLSLQSRFKSDPGFSILKYHFGSRAEKITHVANNDSRKAAKKILAAKEAENVIVMNVDLRSSTKFTEECLKKKKATCATDFVKDYHRVARQAILEREGVFDKTMGDGVMGLFHIFREDLLDFEPHVNLFNSKKDAIYCAFEIFRFIYGKLDEFRKQARYETLTIPPGFGIGGGLSLDTGLVGTMNPGGFDYTVYGNSANFAGKYVGIARPMVIADWLENPSQDPQQLGSKNETSNTELSQSQRINLLKYLREDQPSILLASTEFADAARELEDQVTSYLILPTGSGSTFRDRFLVMIDKKDPAYQRFMKF